MTKTSERNEFMAPMHLGRLAEMLSALIAVCSTMSYKKLLLQKLSRAVGYLSNMIVAASFEDSFSLHWYEHN